jgi:hypothetical protein
VEVNEKFPVVEVWLLWNLGGIGVSFPIDQLGHQDPEDKISNALHLEGYPQIKDHQDSTGRGNMAMCTLCKC